MSFQIVLLVLVVQVSQTLLATLVVIHNLVQSLLVVAVLLLAAHHWSTRLRLNTVLVAAVAV
jgi:hypothetical protein